jgi:cation-transporting ATPase 13A1
VLRRFHFAAALRRMTTVVVALVNNRPSYRVCVKGAPEAIKPLLSASVDNATLSEYERVYQDWAGRGYRVLALATRVVQCDNAEALAAMSRSDLECDLRFAGFLIFECPLREGTVPVLQQLQGAAIHNIMITGDSELTAFAVAKQTGMTTLPCVYGTVDAVTGKLHWSDGCSHTASSLRKLSNTNTVCLTGAALDALSPMEPQHYVSVRVWARCSPAHKEQILVALRVSGYHTLMCGDGTNDVGALKQSHVGVALVYAGERNNNSSNKNKDAMLTSKQSSAAAATTTATTATKDDKAKARKKDNKKDAATPTATTPSKSWLDRFMALQQAQDADLQMQMGDASIAAPFTVRAQSISPVLELIRQGRCTLVTTLQMYFILALNGLINAFSLSVLHLAGVRYGDVQMTTMALFTAGAFFFLSRARPLSTLSPLRPPSAIFRPFFGCALLGQFAIHLACLLAVNHYAALLTPGGFVAPASNAAFSANVVNSCVFLMSSSMTLTTFVVNYQGHPFMHSLRENTGLWRCLALGYLVLVLGALGVLTIPLQLVHLPFELRVIVLALMAGDAMGCFVWEKLSSLVFSKFNSSKVI